MSAPENSGSPEFAAAQTARWAKKDRFSMRYGVAALLPVALIYGFPVAAIAGLRLAILIAWPLRRVRNQRLHVLVFALALGAVMAAIVLMPSGGEMGWAVAGLIVWTAVCGAVGRASVMKMVSRRNTAPAA